MYNVLQPKYKTEIIPVPQTSKNIAKQIQRAIKESKPAAKLLHVHFKGKSDYITCFNVYNYCRNKIKYVRETDNLQSAKTVPRILSDRFGDCKHYTILCCSLLDAAGIPVILRLISQNYYNADPTHIYAVANINGQEVIIDPCMKSFNNEAQYKYKYNLKLI